MFPTLANRLEIIENILPELYIRKIAKEEVSDFEEGYNDEIKLLSIGRFSYAKNFDNVPDICRQIRERGVNVKWYLIGYGSDEKLIQQKIVEAGMQNNVIILGKKDNPYPYIKACDVYVQPSRYEGKSVAVREAQLLGKPIIITEYPTSKSQLQDGVDGFIVPMDNESCANGMVKLLSNRQLLRQVADNCLNEDIALRKEAEKLQHLVD